MRSLLLLWSLAGCSALEGLFGGDEPPPAPAPPAAPSPPPAPADPFAAVRDALEAGKGAEAMTAAEAALAARPGEDAAWDLLELAAVRAGQAGAVLDRLAAETPVGGRADRHHALRATLALAANRPADALAAARALVAASPGDAAALGVDALLAGAPDPGDLDPAWVALRAVRTSADAPWDPVVDALPGERAAMSRARARLLRGEVQAAAREVAAPHPTSLPLRYAVARMVLETTTDPAAAWAAVVPVVQAAREARDPVGAAMLLDLAAPRAFAAWKGEEVLAMATEARKAAEAKQAAEAVARMAAVEASAALRTGQPGLAVDAAKLAASHAATKSRGQWLLALAHAARGDAAAVRADATGLPAVRVQAVRDLAAAMRGENPVIPSPGVEGEDGALQALLAAGWLADPAPARARAAELAPGAADLVLWARTQGSRTPTGLPPTGGLAAEEAVRSALATGSGRLTDGVGHPDAAAWTAILGGAEVPADHRFAPWAKARAAAAARDAPGTAAALADLGGRVRPWRSGPLAPVLVLDDPALPDLAPILAAAAGLPDAVQVDVVRHGWIHRDRTAARLWASGVSLVPPGEGGAGLAVWDAAARYRYLALAWLANGGAFPVEARDALAAAEQKAGLVPGQPLDLPHLQDALAGAAALSFLRTPSGVEALAVTERGSHLYRLPADAERELLAYVAALRAGAGSVSAGDQARRSLIDPLMATLTGYGEYRLIGDLPFALAPVEAFPEQWDGVRYLAAIRQTSHHPDFESLVPPEDPGEVYTLTAVGVFATAEEAVEYQRMFPDGRWLVGQEATVAAWKADAPKARFLLFGDLPASAGGGFVLPNGETLALGDIAAVPLLARSASVAGVASPEQLFNRARVLRRAGVRDLLLVDWKADAAFQRQVLVHYWQSVSQRQPPSKALREARAMAMAATGPRAQAPAWWGGFRLVSSR